MTAFDPETGLRRGAESAAAPHLRISPQRNPFTLALAALWIGGFALAALLLLLGAVGAQSGDQDRGVGALVLAACSTAVAVVAGIAHLAVLAASWRPPEG